MSAPFPQMQSFDTRDAASQHLADIIAGIITEAVSARGEASLALSGGNTPRDAFARLSKKELPWDKVHIGLVDDRWVGEDDPGSNASMLRTTLLQGPASQAKFFGLVPTSITPNSFSNPAFQPTTCSLQGHDLCFMGMGTDGHTASWFPGAEGLDESLNPDNPDKFAFIDASGCPVAGEYPHRITLTLPAVMRARHVVIFITGAEKASVYKKASSKSVKDAPVKALFAAGPRLTTLWAP